MDEAATVLGTDREGIRQAFELGSLDLPGYVHSAGGSFLALLRPLEGGRYETLGLDDCFGKVHITSELTLESQEMYSGSYCRFSGSWQPQEDTGHPVTFDLVGYFRVSNRDLRRAAEATTENRPDSILSVAPVEWWSADSQFYNAKKGSPCRYLEILATNLDYLSRPGFYDVKFHVDDIERIRNNGSTVSSSPQTKLVDLRRDAKETYANVIAALWLKAHGDGGAGKISNDPYSAAIALAKVLADGGIKKPGVDRIGRILADEVAATGIKIGSSEKSA